MTTESEILRDLCVLPEDAQRRIIGGWLKHQESNSLADNISTITTILQEAQK